MKKKKWIIIGIILAILVAGGYFVFRPKPVNYSLAVVQKGNVTQEVSVTGIIKAAEDIDLSFEKSGKVSRIYVDVGQRVSAGQILITQNNNDLVAQLAQAQAGVKASEAKLAELEQGTRPEEIRVQEVKVINARATLIDKIQDAYTKCDDTVSNKIDQFFSNPKTQNPQFNLAISDFQLKRDIETMRFTVQSTLTAWNNSLSQITLESDLNIYDQTAKENLSRVKSFLDKVALAINSLTTNSSLSQTTLDGYKSDISTARTNINTAIINLSGAEATLFLEENQLALEKAGTVSEQIIAQEAAVEEARANAENIEAQIAKTILRAPINGIITKQEAKTGEIAPANTVIVSLISESQFQIEANIPEVDIAKVKIGDSARVTLDAYGSEVFFEAKVVKIDPAETIIEGVATYKTTLQFMAKDERIKSGMTANIDILTNKKEGVLILPQRAVFSSDGEKFVNILENNNKKQIPIKTGLRGSDGNIEIIQGVKEGDKIIISTKP